MKLNLGSGRFPLDGFENLNEPEWMAEDGLPDFGDGTVEAVTSSHLLMYLTDDTVERLLAECYRVLEPRGVLRVTEDETDDPASSRFGGMPGTIFMPSAPRMVRLLYAAGFAVARVRPDASAWRDESLIQQHHGAPPDVFFVEGMK